MTWLRRVVMFGLLLAAVVASPAAAQDSGRHIQFQFTPTKRAQIALWIEKADGTFMATVRLTEAVAYRGIGNRPGDTLMNTGFRYPYGRREGVLPVWAHRRYAATGKMFPRVIFWGRMSTDGIHSGEGYASIHGDPSGANTIDNYFCLSFTNSYNALDAVTCASVFRSNKGRYATQQDVASDYAAEPWQPGDTTQPRPESWRPLGIGSLYPPRRDIAPCTDCTDNPDVFHYADDAKSVMPDIDAVTMATLPGDQPYTVRFSPPPSWPDGNYVAWLEVNTEADYNATFNPTSYGPPAPGGTSGPSTGSDAYWDIWSYTKGIPYRGQPSVVFKVPFVLSASGGAWFASEPVGYSDVNGQSGAITPLSPAITDDPVAAPGSGADRLRMRSDGTRLTVVVKPGNVCAGTNPNPLCGQACVDDSECPDAVLACGYNHVCVDYCDPMFSPPPAIADFEADQYPDDKHSHEWAVLKFTVPDSTRPITQFQVKYGSTPPPTDPNALESWFGDLIDAKAAEIDTVMLRILSTDPNTGDPVPLPAGTPVSADVGQLSPQLRYYFAIRPIDSCDHAGPIVTSSVVTTAIHFSTVTPCFVATAAYGTPLAHDIGILRRFRDRDMLNNPFGRALVSAYYAHGPTAAAFIRKHDWIRAAVRASLAPVVALARFLTH